MCVVCTTARGVPAPSSRIFHWPGCGIGSPSCSQSHRDDEVPVLIPASTRSSNSSACPGVAPNAQASGRAEGRSGRWTRHCSQKVRISCESGTLGAYRSLSAQILEVARHRPRLVSVGVIGVSGRGMPGVSPGFHHDHVHAGVPDETVNSSTPAPYCPPLPRRCGAARSQECEQCRPAAGPPTRLGRRSGIRRRAQPPACAGRPGSRHVAIGRRRRHGTWTCTDQWSPWKGCYPRHTVAVTASFSENIQLRASRELGT